MKIVKFTYKGDIWHVYLVPENEIAEFLDDDDTEAEVQWDKKEIYINDAHLILSTVWHELMHMSAGYQYVQDSGLDFAQAEEVFCNIFSYEGEKLLKLGQQIFDALKQLKVSEDDELVIEL